MDAIHAERHQKRLRSEDIGGGRVRQAFRLGDKYMAAGTRMTREEILSIPFQNRDALIGRFIEVWPEDGPAKAPFAAKGPAKRIMVHIGAGRFNVFEGWQINTEPLNKEEAQELAEEE